MTVDVDRALHGIRSWGEARDWRGWDPYDALNSPLARPLTLGRPLGRRLLTQAVKLSPLNLRPLLGIRPAHNAKAIGLVASGYARLRDFERADRWLRWLVENRAPTAAGAAWGYHFPVQTRVFRYARNAPNVIATSFVAQAFLDRCEISGERGWEQPVHDAVEYMRRHLRHGPYFTYLEGEDELVHNANALACAVLARAVRVLGRDDLLVDVRAALEVTLAQQRPDGSWPYADRPGHDWVDNFHTGYVLDSLAECARLLPEVLDPLRRGVDHWHERMFLPDGRPKYFVDRVYPLDAHCYATGVDTWLALLPHRPEALERADRLAALLVEDMLAPDGHVRFQRRRRFTNSVPMIRWTAAPSFKALAGVRLAHLG